ncbi:MFS transporter [Vibrio sp. SCSIO 43137]|uniref:MFS transporter n=1 Tax=Vibrio sp. SCSIO 43137 TaxID=3021011 RepID=UPI002307A930|nr:MFS transporter [Vibrio sp. SCSIO 43137]WCE28806.1 MFS transporter [Vibrio sp. SCSIO 43137]
MSYLNSDSYVKIGLKEKLGYGFGDFGSNLSFNFISLFLLYYYTDIYGLSATEASMIFVVARVIDAVYNLLIGYVIDRTNTKYGKLRPYLLYGAIPMGILSAICFIGIDSEYKAMYALVVYTIYSLAYTTINTPYSAMNNTITQHEGSRASLSVYRMAMAMLAYTFVASVAEPLISTFSDPSQGYTYTALIFSAVSALFILVCFFMTKERVVATPNELEEKSIKESIAILKENTPLHVLSAYTVFVYVFFSIDMAITYYYFSYVLGDVNLMGSVLTIGAGASAVGTVISGKLTELLGKKTLCLYSLFGLAISTGIRYYVPADDITLQTICIAGSSFFMGINFVVMWAMVPDTVEYSELKSKVRAEGVVYGYFNFVTKIAMAIGGGIAGVSLDLFGYDANAVTQEAINGISMMVTIVPAILSVLAAVCIYFYKIDEKYYREIIQAIEIKKRTAN